MAELPSLVADGQNLPALTLDEDYIKCSWDTIPRECIPNPNRPCGPLSAAVTKTLSMLALIAPGEKGLSTAQRLISATVRTRLEKGGTDTPVVQEEDMQNALNDMYSLLSAVRDIVKARRKNADLLRKHGFISDDPFEWPFGCVIILWDLVKQTGKNFSRGNEAGRYLDQHYQTRFQKEPNSPNMIIKSDVVNAIESLNSSSSQDDDTTPNTGTTNPDNINVKHHFCTTGTIFQPSLPPLGVLVGIGKIYYRAKKHTGVPSTDGPLIMSYEVARKGMYYDNAGSKKLGTFLKHDGRNWSYKNLELHKSAISKMERRFGKRFCEIFNCPDIQADQALRLAENVLDTLNEITRTHSINNVDTLHKVFDDFFTKFPKTERLRSLTTDGIKTLREQLDAAAAPNAQGVKYAGWPSLSGDAAAGPATPLEDPPLKPIRRRNRDDVSPAGSGALQPAAKKFKSGASGFTLERRESYVSNHVPEMGALAKARNPQRRASGPASTLASTSNVSSHVPEMGALAEARNPQRSASGPASTLASILRKDLTNNVETPGRAVSTPTSTARKTGDTGLRAELVTTEEDAPAGTSAPHRSAHDNGKRPSTDAIIDYASTDDAADVTPAEGSHAGPSTAQQSVAKTIQDAEWESDHVVDQVHAIIQSVQGFAHSNANRIRDVGGMYLDSAKTCEELRARAEGAENALDAAQLRVAELEQKLRKAEDTAVEIARRAEQSSKAADGKVKAADGKVEAAEERAKAAEAKFEEAKEQVAVFHKLSETFLKKV